MTTPRYFRIPHALPNDAWYKPAIAVDAIDLNGDGKIDLILRTDHELGVSEKDLKPFAQKLIQKSSQLNGSVFKPMNQARQRYLAGLMHGTIKAGPKPADYSTLALVGAGIAIAVAPEVAIPVIVGGALATACSDERHLERSGDIVESPPVTEETPEAGWDFTFNGPASRSDRGVGIALDPGGNIYISGVEANEGVKDNIVIFKLRPNGEEEWVYRPQAVDSDPSPKLYGYAGRITTDLEGNVYFTGGVGERGVDGNLNKLADLFIQKLDNSGKVLWTHRWDGSMQGYDMGFDISVDPEGNVIAVGTTMEAAEDGGSNRYILLQKMDPNDGSLLWSRTYSGPEYDFDSHQLVSAEYEGRGVIVDSDGNIYITGYERTNNGIHYYTFIYKLDSNGNMIWRQSHKSGNFSIGNDITLDKNGFLYVTGFEGNKDPISNIGDPIWIQKRRVSGGSVDWTKTELGQHEPLPEPELPYATILPRSVGHAVAVDTESNVYVTGFISIVSQREHAYQRSGDIWLRKYDSDGNELWTDTFDGTQEGGHDAGLDIVLDERGNIYLTGFVETDGEEKNIWVRKIPKR